jgi:L-fuconolactonase
MTLAGVVDTIIDSHVHQWDVPRSDHGQAGKAKLYQRAPWLVGRLFPYVTPRSLREFVRTPQHVLRPYLPADLAADLSPVAEAVGVGVSSVIHVQADWHGADPAGETRFLESLDWGGVNPDLDAIVGYADPRTPDFAAVLDRHAEASPRFRGIRCMGAWHPDTGVHKYADEAGLLASRDFLKGFAALAERGFTFDAYVYSYQLDDVATLAAEFPETTIVLDHYAPPVGWGGPMAGVGRTAGERARLVADWHDGISRLATHQNVVAKHSGLAFPILGLPDGVWGRERIADTMRPLIDHTQDSFGTDRTLFGSNFPMDKALAAYADVVGALVDVLEPRGNDVLAAVFAGNARRIYSL